MLIAPTIFIKIHVDFFISVIFWFSSSIRLHQLTVLTDFEAA